MTQTMNAAATTPDAPSVKRELEFVDNRAQLRRQCPQCREMVDLAHATCEGCGLRFFQTPQSFGDQLQRTCLSVAGCALLGTIILTVVKYFQ